MGKKKKVAVIGAGASGITAAIAAAREGASVTLIEHKDRIGKKILSTGNGRCNFTNEYMKPDCFRGEDASIVRHVLEKFGTAETLRFFSEIGLVAKSKMGGYYYPKSEQASAVADVLSLELKRLDVTVLLDTHVTEIKKKKDFFIKTDAGNLNADCVILATGGKASSVLGSDGSGYALAKAFGHSIAPVVPALVQLQGKGTFFKQVSGVRADAKVSLYVDGIYTACDTGELQLTNYGISGIPVFQISRFASMALYEKKKCKVLIDFMPDMETTGLLSFFLTRKEQNVRKTAEEFLIGIFNKKLIPVLLYASGIDKKETAEKLTEEKLLKLAEKCKAFEIEITGTNSFEQAQVCAGGVRTGELDADTMQSKYVKDLYITGELLDVDGICGGYNLQWAWATGYIAGSHAAKGI